MAAAGHRVVTLVTGANRGLGFELSKQLLRLGGFHVIVSARSWKTGAGTAFDALSRAHEAAAVMPTRHSSGLDFVELDVTSQTSRFVLQEQLAKVLGKEQKLDVLVNNAGIYLDGWTAENVAACVQTNCVGPLRLAQELSPLFSREGHVINVSTGMAKLSLLSDKYRAALADCKTVEELVAGPALSFDPSDPKMKADSFTPYKLSKAGLNRGTQLLAKELKGVARVSSVDPGWCKTDMGGAGAPRTAFEGASSIFQLVVGAPELTGTGKYFNSAGKAQDY